MRREPCSGVQRKLEEMPRGLILIKPPDLILRDADSISNPDHSRGEG